MSTGGTIRVVGSEITYVCKIAGFWKTTKHYASNEFQVADRFYLLQTELLSLPCMERTIFGIYLRPRDLLGSPSLSYKMIVVDRGQEWMRAGKIEGPVNWEQPLLGLITEINSRLENITETEVLTIRLTLQPNEIEPYRF